MERADYTLNKKQRLEPNNSNLGAAISFKDIYDAAMHNSEFAKSRETLTNQFRKGGYPLDIEGDDSKKSAALLNTSESPASDEGQTEPNDREQLAILLQSADDIIHMLEWWRSNQTESQITNNRLHIPVPDNGEQVRKTISINSQIWNEWKIFCGKHKDFREKELLAKALWCYINTEG